MVERKVDGVAVMTFGEEEPVLDQLTHRGVPIVLAEFKLDDPKASTILLDYSTGMNQAVRHLASLGHRAIAFLAGPYSLHSAITRENDFRAAMQAAGLPLQKKVGHRMRSHPQGRRLRLEQLNRLTTRPTAIVCSNDMTAIGVLRAAYTEGLRIPQDLSVIGLDDIAFAEYTLPSLTTIRLSRTDLACAASMPSTPRSRSADGSRYAARVPGLNEPCRPRFNRRPSLAGFLKPIWHSPKSSFQSPNDCNSMTRRLQSCASRRDMLTKE